MDTKKTHEGGPMDNIEDYFTVNRYRHYEEDYANRSTQKLHTVDTERLEYSRNPEDDIVLSYGLIDSYHNNFI